MARIAFLGTGVMGLEMAGNLLKAGHQLTVYNRTKAKTKPLVKAGAAHAETPAKAVNEAEFIISITGDDDASRSVWLGKDGVIDGAFNPKAIAIESATLSRQWVLELDQKLRDAGLRFIDCPVTGGPDGAQKKELTLLVGADSKTIAEAWPVLSAYAKRYILFGPVGSGTAYKILVNLMGAVQGAALAEGMAAAERAGLNLSTMVEALSSGAVASPHVKYLAERMAKGDHDRLYFSARWRHKDAAYGLKLAAELGIDMPCSAQAEKLYQKAIDQGLGDKNSSVIFELLRAKK